MAARPLEALSSKLALGTSWIFRNPNNSSSLPRLRSNFNSLVICCAQSVHQFLSFVDAKAEPYTSPHHLIFVLRLGRKCCLDKCRCLGPQKPEKLLVVVGGGAAGVFGAIRAKDVAPHLRVVVIEKGKLLSKVKVSGGGRCNVTNGHHVDGKILAEHYPRGHKELKGSFFKMHGPLDTMSWFNDHGAQLKIEDDGRVFPVSDSSSTIVNCLLDQARRSGVELQTGKVLMHASRSGSGRFVLSIEKVKMATVETVESDYLLIATGSSRQGFEIAAQLGHSIVQPMPSLFTLKIEDKHLLDLAGVTFPKVKATLTLQNVRNVPQFVQTLLFMTFLVPKVGPMLVTHWGLSGPVILRLSAWGARDLFGSNYKETKGPELLSNAAEFGEKILEGVNEDVLWASVSKTTLSSIALLMKQCSFTIVGKGQFKDEFVTAGGVPLTEITLSTMESRKEPGLFFAGEVLNVDGVTGGFNFQNAWSGAYIAGTRIGEVALGVACD
ncbi:Uncharacterized protein EJ110_NYTH08215 [Nymphaea thermarum]|nr:Uncharacterized protein EJ110_NYTH08215 [Nymphaea thermarum]